MFKDIETTREFFKNDGFVVNNGIKIVSDGVDSVVCSIDVTPSVLNAEGFVHGGIIFSLADIAFSVAANSENVRTVTLESNINYLAPAKEGCLVASAQCVRDGKNVSVYSVRVFDNNGKDVAIATFTGYKTSKG